MSGEVAINVTIDADGKVVRTEVVSGNPLLWKASTDNIQKWTFSKPPHGPLTQTMFYVYKLDGISKDNAALAKVSFDLPDHVNIVATFFT
ncbi:MAG: energy transducer TonB, partial [Candidatus Acidiferrales bacterium]